MARQLVQSVLWRVFHCMEFGSASSGRSRISLQPLPCHARPGSRIDMTIKQETA